MNVRMIVMAIACAGLAALPSIALADDAMKHDAAMMASLLCRNAMPGEKPTAVTTDAAKTALVCKVVQPDMMMHGPKMSKAMSADQIDTQWRDFIQSALYVQGGTG